MTSRDLIQQHDLNGGERNYVISMGKYWALVGVVLMSDGSSLK